jgi:signal transduction histidine kinase
VVETFNKIVLELNQQKQATEMAQQRAESASQAKTEFLSSMSHEFRTPLNAVMGFAELLASDTETPLNEEQIEFLQYIIENGEYLLLLIDDVLHLIQIDDPALATEREPVDVISIIEEVCNRIRPLAEQHALVIHNHTANMKTKYVLADREKLWQVLLNIALNAVNYNVEKGAIQFTCENITENTIRLSIIDSGIGVDDEDLSKLFEPFNRLHNENTAVLGAGIGLTVCQKLITLMKGQIGVKKNHDRGLTFWIDLESADNLEV